MRLWLALPAVLLLTACEPRAPLNRGQVVAIGDNLQRQEGVMWGDPAEVLAPGPAADGRSWWQVRYPGGELVLVDATTGWARRPWAGYAPRSQAVPVAAVAGATPLVVIDGSLVYQLAAPEELTTERLGEMEREAARLNALAVQYQLHPLFSLRIDRQGRSSLLYGWQGDRGIARDEHIADWVRLRTPWRGEWIELLP
jgi:hypothetical protein